MKIDSISKQGFVNPTWVSIDEIAPPSDEILALAEILAKLSPSKRSKT